MFRIRSSVTQRRQQPRERQHEESGQWSNNNKKKTPWFYFHARRGSRCSSCVSTRTTRKSQAQRAGHNQQIFHKDNLCVSLLILHSAYLKSHHWMTQMTAFIAQNNWLLPGLNISRVFSAPKNVSLPRTVPLNWIFTDAGRWAKWKIQQNLHLLNQS